MERLGPSLQNLKRLKRLNVAYNKIYDHTLAKFVPFLGHLTSLEAFDIGPNKFTEKSFLPLKKLTFQLNGKPEIHMNSSDALTSQGKDDWSTFTLKRHELCAFDAFFVCSEVQTSNELPVQKFAKQDGDFAIRRRVFQYLVQPEKPYEIEPPQNFLQYLLTLRR